MEEQVAKAIKIFNQGGIVIFPTDTAFGIGCRIDNVDTVRRLFKLRKRAKNKAMPVLVSSVSMARRYVLKFPDDVYKLTEKYWPGALTIVLCSNLSKVPLLVRGGKETIGLRMPNNQQILTVIEAIGVPILGSSANFANEQTPYSITDLDKKLVQQADFVLPGECKLKQASTVIDCTFYPWTVLRKGAVTIDF